MDGKLDNVITKLDDMAKNQKKLDDKVQLLGETVAERRATAVGMIAQILPFKTCGRQLDIFFASSLCRKYLLYYLQPLLECLDETNLMSAIANKVIKNILCPLAAGHCAFGDTPNGIRKMLCYKRVLPQPFAAWVLGSVIQYVRKTYDLRGQSVKENFLSCKGAMQNKLSNDRQKIVKCAIENAPTVADTCDVLYNLDMEFRADMLHAIPEEVTVMTRAEYDAHIKELKPVERKLEVEERGARPVNKEYSNDPDIIFKDALEDAKSVISELDMFRLIRILEVITKEKNRFNETNLTVGIAKEYDDLVVSGQLELKDAVQRFNMNDANLLADDDGLAELPQIDPEEEERFELQDPEEMLSQETGINDPKPTTSRKRTVGEPDKPKKKRKRICTSARSQRKADKRFKNVQAANKSSTVDESRDEREFAAKMKSVNEMKFKKLQKKRKEEEDKYESGNETEEDESEEMVEEESEDTDSDDQSAGEPAEQEQQVAEEMNVASPQDDNAAIDDNVANEGQDANAPSADPLPPPAEFLD